jgi:hypothetical protein
MKHCLLLTPQTTWLHIHITCSWAEYLFSHNQQSVSDSSTEMCRDKHVTILQRCKPTAIQDPTQPIVWLIAAHYREPISVSWKNSTCYFTCLDFLETVDNLVHHWTAQRAGNDNEVLNCEWYEPILPNWGSWITCCRILVGMTASATCSAGTLQNDMYNCALFILLKCVPRPFISTAGL